MLNQSTLNKFLIYSFFLLYFLIMGVWLLKVAFFSPLHEDEYNSVARGLYFELFVQGNMTDEAWNMVPSYDQPKFGEYIWRLFLYTNGVTDIRQYLENIHFNCDYDDPDCWYIAYSRDDSPGILKLPEHIKEIAQPIFFLRYIAVAISFVTLCFVFAIGTILRNKTLGFILSLNIFLSDLFQRTTTRVMGDVILIFLSILHLLITLFFTNKKDFKESRKLKVQFLIMIGILDGVILSTKLNGIFIIFTFFVTILFLSKCLFFKKVSSLLFLCIYSLITFSTFILLNPYLYQHPLLNTFKMFQYRQEVTERQQMLFPELSLDTVVERIHMTYEQVFSNVLMLFLFLLCLLLMAFRFKNNKQQYIVVGAFCILPAFLTMMLVSFNLDRYFLPIVISVKLIEGISAYEFLLKQHIDKRTDGR